MHEDFGPIESLGGAFHPHAIEVQDFSTYALILDVRPRAAFEDDHIPGAIQVDPPGTSSAQSPIGTDTAGAHMLVARDVAGEQLPEVVALAVAKVRFDEAILVYCGRGGLDSQPVAQALRWRGWTVDVLPGGWVNYRRWVQAGLEVVPRLVMFRVVSCSLASESAAVLEALRAAGEQVLDVEDLAGQPGMLQASPASRQPLQALFESRLLDTMRALDPRRPVWVGDFGSVLGSLTLPGALREALASAPLADVRIDLLARVRHWRQCEPLAGLDPEQAVDALSRLHPPPKTELLARWREHAEHGNAEALLQDFLVSHIDVQREARNRDRLGASNALPPLVAPSLDPEALAAALVHWLPPSNSDPDDINRR